MPDEHGIGTYPVGLLLDIKRKRLRVGLRYVWREIKARKWRAVKNSFNGYLAEWHYPPEGLIIYTLGHGWTRKRALRRLGRNIVEANLSLEEQKR